MTKEKIMKIVKGILVVVGLVVVVGAAGSSDLNLISFSKLAVELAFGLGVMLVGTYL